MQRNARRIVSQLPSSCARRAPPASVARLRPTRGLLSLPNQYMNIPRYDTHGLQESERFVDTANVQAPVAERPQQLAVVLYSNVLEYSRVLLPRRGNNRRDGTDAPPPTSVDASLVPPLALAPLALASWMMRVRTLHSIYINIYIKIYILIYIYIY